MKGMSLSEVVIRWVSLNLGIPELFTKLDQVSSNIMTLNDRLAALEGLVQTFPGKLDNIQTALQNEATQAEAIRAELAQVKEQLGGNGPELDRVISSLESLGGRLDSMSTDISNIIPDVTEIPPTDAPEPTPEPDTLEGGNGTPVEPTEPTEEI